MCIACMPETEARPIAAATRPAAGVDLEYGRALVALAFRDEVKAGTLVRCRCGSMFRPADSEEAITRRGMCCTCESQWIEDRILIPLVERLGRKGARRALRRLADGK